jgi:hypothetical protein
MSTLRRIDRKKTYIVLCGHSEPRHAFSIVTVEKLHFPQEAFLMNDLCLRSSAEKAFLGFSVQCLLFLRT